MLARVASVVLVTALLAGLSPPAAAQGPELHAARPPGDSAERERSVAPDRAAHAREDPLEAPTDLTLIREYHPPELIGPIVMMSTSVVASGVSIGIGIILQAMIQAATPSLCWMGCIPYGPELSWTGAPAGVGAAVLIAGFAWLGVELDNATSPAPATALAPTASIERSGGTIGIAGRF